MLQAIADAKESVTIEAYIYWAGAVGLELRTRWPIARATA